MQWKLRSLGKLTRPSTRCFGSEHATSQQENCLIKGCESHRGLWINDQTTATLENTSVYFLEVASVGSLPMEEEEILLSSDYSVLKLGLYCFSKGAFFFLFCFNCITKEQQQMVKLNARTAQDISPQYLRLISLKYNMWMQGMLKQAWWDDACCCFWCLMLVFLFLYACNVLAL